MVSFNPNENPSDHLYDLIDDSLKSVFEARKFSEKSPDPDLDQTLGDVFYDRVSRFTNANSYLESVIGENLSSLKTHQNTLIKNLNKTVIQKINSIAVIIRGNTRLTGTDRDYLLSCIDTFIKFYKETTIEQTFGDVFYEKASKLAKKHSSPFYTQLTDALKPLEKHKNTLIKNLPDEVLLQINHLKNIKFNPSEDSYLNTNHFNSSANDSGIDLSTESTKIDPSYMSYKEKVALMKRIYSEPRNKEKDLSEDSINQSNQKCATFLKDLYNFSDEKDITSKIPKCALSSLTPSEETLLPSSEAPENYNSVPSSFYVDIVNGRFSFLTVKYENETISTKSNGSADALIEIAKNLTKLICPKDLSEELRKKMINTILINLTQHSLLPLAAEYITQTKQAMSDSDIDFNLNTDSVEVSLSPSYDSENNIIPGVVQFHITACIKHRYSELKTDLVDQSRQLEKEQFNKLRDDLGVGSVATTTFNGGFELHLDEKNETITPKNLHQKFLIALDD